MIKKKNNNDTTKMNINSTYTSSVKQFIKNEQVV